MQFMKQRKWTIVKSKDRAFLCTQVAGIGSKKSLILQQSRTLPWPWSGQPHFQQEFSQASRSSQDLAGNAHYVPPLAMTTIMNKH